MANKKSPNGYGTIRKKEITKNGKTYTYFEARITTGFDPGTGKQIQRSFSGKTQKEVLQKLQTAAVQLREGTYTVPSKLTFGGWLDTWRDEFLVDVKPLTQTTYASKIEHHLKPALGAIKLQDLTSVDLQRLYNTLTRKNHMAAKSVHAIHTVAHSALQKAVELKLIPFNPAVNCKLPKIKPRKMVPLDDDGIAKFLNAIQGHKFQNVYVVDLFTGLRRGEILGLTWDKVDFQHNTILIDQQLQKEPKKDGQFLIVSVKNESARVLHPIPLVMDALKNERDLQDERREHAGEFWSPSNLVFTNAAGRYLSPTTVYKNYKSIMVSIGMPDSTFHDLRHSFAVASLRAGTDIKTLQDSLGHATAAFTLKVYGHVTDMMRISGSEKMNAYYNAEIKPKNVP